MLTEIIFIIIGLLVGFMQYGLIKTAAKYTAEKTGGVFGVIAIKFLLYGILAVALVLWFKNYLFYCATGVAMGIIATGVLDYFRNRTKNSAK